jgi:signal transduction histidine kinase
MEGQMTSRRVLLSFDPPEPDPPVEADPQHLRRIFLNLIRNAVQAQPDGGEIRISWQNTERGVTVSMTDRGGGIPLEVQDQVFEPFFTTRESGTGLGLAIVKSLVEANGGGIRLVRSDQGGTEFDITLRRYDGLASP